MVRKHLLTVSFQRQAVKRGLQASPRFIGFHVLWEFSPSSDSQRGRGVRQAAPLAATQDTSGEGRQDPCPVLQPTAQPASRLHLQANPLWRGKTARHRGIFYFIFNFFVRGV